MKLTLRPNARTKLRELRQQADAVAQQPVAPMTKGETRAFLDRASTAREGFLVKVSGMSREEQRRELFGDKDGE